LRQPQQRNARDDEAAGGARARFTRVLAPLLCCLCIRGLLESGGDAATTTPLQDEQIVERICPLDALAAM